MKVMDEAKSRAQTVKLCKSLLFFLRDTSAEHGLHFLHAWDQISSNTVLKLQLHQCRCMKSLWDLSNKEFKPLLSVTVLKISTINKLSVNNLTSLGSITSLRFRKVDNRPTAQWLFGLGRREEPEVKTAILTFTPEVPLPSGS